MIERKQFNTYEDAIAAGFKIDMGNSEYGRQIADVSGSDPKTGAEAKEAHQQQRTENGSQQ